MRLRSAPTRDGFAGHLADGTDVLFRRVRPGDKQGFKDAFEKLSPESRYRRFFSNVIRLSDAQLSYLTEIDFVDHFAWVCVTRDADEIGIGVGRWVRDRGDPGVAEAAVTVVDAYQRLGIGGTLLHLAMRSAVEHGIHSFRVWVLGENQPVVELLKRLGASPGRWEDGVLSMTVPLPRDPADLEATPAPLILKAVGTGRLESRGSVAGRIAPLLYRLQRSASR